MPSSRSSAAFYYWFPKITGRMLSEPLGKWQFWLFFIGFNVTFFPMHILGLAGHAAACLHLRGRERLGNAQPDFVDWRGHDRVSVLLFVVNVAQHSRASGPAPTHGARARSNGDGARRRLPVTFILRLPCAVVSRYGRRRASSGTSRA